MSAPEPDAQAVQARFRDLILHALAFSSGAADAISYLALGGVFSAFMTGNIAFLGLRVAGARSPGGWAILSAICAFALGVYLSARIVKPSEGPCIWPQRVTVALGFSLIPHVLFVAVWSAMGGQPPRDVAHVLLGFWGLAMGMQSAAVRRLRVEGVFTTAATATIIVLVSDITNWSATAQERRRLAGVLLSLFAGATAGGVLLVHAHRNAPLLTLVVSAAAVATAAIVFRKRDAQGDGRAK